MGNILDLLGRLSAKKKDTRVLLLGLDNAGTYRMAVSGKNKNQRTLFFDLTKTCVISQSNAEISMYR